MAERALRGHRRSYARALAALVVTLGGGYLLILALEAVVKAVVPAGIEALPTFSAAVESAQLGVSFSLWALIVGLIFAPGESGSVGVSRTARTALVAGLASPHT